jgi:hypothetical protein
VMLIRGRPDLTDRVKAKLLGENARRFYRM